MRKEVSLQNEREFRKQLFKAPSISELVHSTGELLHIP
jgi:hypothetical protein